MTFSTHTTPALAFGAIQPRSRATVAFGAGKGDIQAAASELERRLAANPDFAQLRTEMQAPHPAFGMPMHPKTGEVQLAEDRTAIEVLVPGISMSHDSAAVRERLADILETIPGVEATGRTKTQSTSSFDFGDFGDIGGNSGSFTFQNVPLVLAEKA